MSGIFIRDYDGPKKVKYVSSEELEKIKKEGEVCYIGYDKASWVDVYTVLSGPLKGYTLCV